MSPDKLYPWQEVNWKQFQSQRKQSRLPHALMLKGIDGLGTEQLATTIGESLLCKNPDAQGFACRNCVDCKLTAAGTHPDFHHITVQDTKHYINIEQIRDLVNLFRERPHQGGYRVAIIDPCSSMNAAAANSLLKTLEEPGDDTLLILVSNTGNSLPATVQSRCQLMNIHAPSEQIGVNWLKKQHSATTNNTLLALRLSHHAPLKAKLLLTSDKFQIRQKFLLAMIKAAQGNVEPVKMVSDIKKSNFNNDAIDWMYSLILDAQKLSHQVAEEQLTNIDQLDLLRLVNANHGHKQQQWIDRLIDARRLMATSSNINPQLLIEDLIFRWIAIFQ